MSAGDLLLQHWNNETDNVVLESEIFINHESDYATGISPLTITARTIRKNISWSRYDHHVVVLERPVE